MEFIFMLRMMLDVILYHLVLSMGLNETSFQISLCSDSFVCRPALEIQPAIVCWVASIHIMEIAVPARANELRVLVKCRGVLGILGNSSENKNP